ncbi:MAG: hypothetical protein N3A66_09155, partial [Planctomycetota bacterium]|nr:hypothetical protein [Planctomycetota bacterium]
MGSGATGRGFGERPSQLLFQRAALRLPTLAVMRCPHCGQRRLAPAALWFRHPLRGWRVTFFARPKKVIKKRPPWGLACLRQVPLPEATGQ